MANHHYGRIGDLWKHLPLAEILSREKPARYAESHAGSGTYPLTHSPERDYGIFHFLRHVAESPELRSCAYARVVEPLASGHGLYPGSPFIALAMLPEAEFLFCDLDGESLRNIEESARLPGRSLSRLRCLQQDGVTVCLESIPWGEDLLVHIDAFQPFTKTASGASPIEVFWQLSAREVRSMFWYGYDHAQQREETRMAATEGLTSPVWFGEICLDALRDRDYDFNPGVRGCVVMCSNLDRGTLEACTRLGEGLASIYQDSTLTGNRSGALRFLAGQWRGRS